MKKLTVTTNNKLEARVKSIINHQGYDTIEDFMQDLNQGGCQSGLIGDLIYYTDTVRFYKKYQPEINELLRDTMDQTGINNLSELFGDKWQDDDPLATDQMNQNLLAWFGFEETARILAERAGIES